MEEDYLQVSKRWTPVAIWMALIFAFSTDWFAGSNTISFFGSLLSWLMPGIAAETIQIIHAGLRKLGHWTEYFILATLLGLRAKLNGRNRTGATVLPRR